MAASEYRGEPASATTWTRVVKSTVDSTRIDKILVDLSEFDGALVERYGRYPAERFRGSVGSSKRGIA
jgi:hypothetical protein